MYIVIIGVILLVCILLVWAKRKDACDNKFYELLYGAKKDECKTIRRMREPPPTVTLSFPESLFNVDSDYASLMAMSDASNDILMSPDELRNWIENAKPCLVEPNDEKQCPDGYLLTSNQLALGGEKHKEYTLFDVPDHCCTVDVTSTMFDDTKGVAEMWTAEGIKLGVEIVITPYTADRILDGYKNTMGKWWYKRMVAGGFVDKATDFIVKEQIERTMKELASDTYQTTLDLADSALHHSTLFSDTLKERTKTAIKELVDGNEDYLRGARGKNWMGKELRLTRVNETYINNLHETGNLDRKVTNILKTQSITQYSQKLLSQADTVYLRKAVPNVIPALHKRVMRKVARTSVRIQARFVASLNKAAMYMAAGPAGLALFVFEVISTLIDLWDPLGFNDFTTMKVAKMVRNNIEINQRLTLHRMGAVFTIHADGQPFNANGPIVYPPSNMYPEQWGKALGEYQTKLLQEYIFTKEELMEELDHLVEKRISLILQKQQNMKFYFEIPPDCPNPLPELGSEATAEENAELEDKRRRGGLTKHDQLNWERVNNFGTTWWMRSAHYTEGGMDSNRDMGCFDPEHDWHTRCPCREINDEAVEMDPGAVFAENHPEQLDAIIQYYNDHLHMLSYRIPPRERAKLLYEIFLTHLTDQEKTHICFCPDLLPRDDHPTNMTFDSIDRAIGLSERGQKEQFHKLAIDEEGNVQQTLKDYVSHPVYFPIWSKYYRVRNSTDPGTIQEPNAVEREIPPLTVTELVPISEINGRAFEPYESTDPPSGEGTEEPSGEQTSREEYVFVTYKRSEIAQLSPLAGTVVTCLEPVKHSDITDLIPQTHQCNIYRRPISEPSSVGEWTKTSLPDEYTKAPRLHTQSRCLGNTVRELQEVGRMNGWDYKTEWEPIEGYKDFKAAKPDINPKSYGVTFDHDRGLCRYTQDFCTRYGLQYHTSEEDGTPDCKPFPGSGVFEFLFGTTVTRSVIIGAMMADKYLGIANDRLASYCTSGHELYKGKADSIESVIGSGACPFSLALQGVRSVVQVGAAIMGGALMPIEKGAGELMNTMEYAVGCIGSGFDLKRPDCKDFLLSPISIVYAGFNGVAQGQDYIADSTIDAVGDLLQSVGIPNEEVEAGLNHLYEFTTIFSVFHNVSAEGFKQSIIDSVVRPGTYGDSTVTARLPFSPMSLSIGKNTNACFADYCVDDLAKNLADALFKKCENDEECRSVAEGVSGIVSSGITVATEAYRKAGIGLREGAGWVEGAVEDAADWFR